MIQQFAGLTEENQDPLIQNDNFISHIENFLQVMGNHQRCGIYFPGAAG
jgi:hypothetical protein